MDQPAEIPLTETTYFILLSLSPKTEHGYAIMKDVQALSEGRIIPSGNLHPSDRHQTQRLLIRSKLKDFPHPVVVERADEHRPQPQGHRLKVNIFRSAADLDVDISNPPLPVFDRGALIYPGNDDHSRSILKGWLIQCSAAEVPAEVAFENGEQLMAFRSVAVDASLEISHLPRQQVNLQWIERPGRGSGPQAAGMRDSLRGPKQLRNLRQRQRLGGIFAHRPAFQQGLLNGHAALVNRSRQGD